MLPTMQRRVDYARDENVHHYGYAVDNIVAQAAG